MPDELLDSARVDGAGEFRTFISIASRVMVPALVMVFLFQFVATWNNYFLPLVMLSDASLYPIPVGLQTWNSTTYGGTHPARWQPGSLIHPFLPTATTKRCT